MNVNRMGIGSQGKSRRRVENATKNRESQGKSKIKTGRKLRIQGESKEGSMDENLKSHA
jgi:hypothetical protein